MNGERWTLTEKDIGTITLGDLKMKPLTGWHKVLTEADDKLKAAKADLVAAKTAGAKEDQIAALKKIVNDLKDNLISLRKKQTDGEEAPSAA